MKFSNVSDRQPKSIVILLACWFFVQANLCGLEANAAPQQPSLVPQPHSIKVDQSKVGFDLTQPIVFATPSASKLGRQHFSVVGQMLKSALGCKFTLATESNSANFIWKHDPTLAAEAYRLKIHGGRITINAATLKSATHATATVLQLAGQYEREIPTITIEDRPSCSYRSFMIDLGRNPHSLESLRETIDLLWYYKMDSLHLHLTDDQRFAFPSQAFPKLQTQSDKITWDEFAELEIYAQTRGVTLIPELEVPGHSTLLRKAYPEVFGKNGTEIATRPESIAAIKTLLDEMIELFPSSPYLHIGGDEAYGVPVELQRSLINQLHAHLKSKGKKTIVWEGPRAGTGDNKVHPEVIHINWRTIDYPADKMLADGHPVVNAAWDPLYIVDHYPRNNFTMASPEYIYDNLELCQFKHFNPGMKTFQNPIRVEPNDQLIGFCMPWWEGREINYFPLIVPRLIPLAEIAWNSETPKKYSNFQTKKVSTESIRQAYFHPVSITAANLALERESVFHNHTVVKMTAPAGTIRYTLDGSEPSIKSSIYQSPLELEKSTTVRATAFQDSKQLAHGTRRTFVGVHPTPNLALGKPATTNITTGPVRSINRLTDGGTGNLDYFLGYPSEPEPILITVDLGEVMQINEVVLHLFSNGEAFESYVIEISSDGKNFRKVATRLEKPQEPAASVIHDFPKTEARFVRVATHGCKGYVFDSFSKITEIQVFKVTQQESP